MCGIYLHVASSQGISTSPPTWLVRRGPDHQGQVQWQSCDSNSGASCVVTLQASVLSMRQGLSRQPVSLYDASNDDGSRRAFLCWNGEVYRASFNENDEHTSEHVGEPAVSDTDFVADLLRKIFVKEENPCPDIVLPRIASALSRLVDAEFALCVATSDWIYYAKDPWGRRSLLVGTRVGHDDEDNSSSNPHDKWILSSVSVDAVNDDMEWTEVEPGIVFAHDVAHGTTQKLAYSPTTIAAPLAKTMSTDPVETLYQLLRVAVRQRIVGSHQVAVLFSGGLDSVVLAALVLQETNQVTLTNVSFVADTDNVSTPDASSTAADTRAAVASYGELRQLFPDAAISFCQRQVPWNHVQEQQARLKRLIYPKTTVMDLNIATAFWFAAETATSCRILLTGLGADEQMGGYGRHRKAWEKRAGTNSERNEALLRELRMDQNRLWERNLGRDDRVLSDTSKETRYPYLDSAVVQHLAALDVDRICDFHLPPGQGDKHILRQVAARLGLKSASVAVKRAIQFGSRIAHVHDKKVFGSRRKATGEAHYENSSKGNGVS